MLWIEHGLYCLKWLSIDDGWMELSFQTSLYCDWPSYGAECFTFSSSSLILIRIRRSKGCQDFVHKDNSGHLWQAREMPVLGLEYVCSTWAAKLVSL